MTIICGVRTPSGTWIGSDRRLTNGHVLAGTASKWAHGRKLSIGFSGHVVVMRAVEHHIGKFKHDMDSFSIWKAMRAIFKTVDLRPIDKADSEDPPYYGNPFIFATADRLVMFGGDGGSVDARTDEFFSRGSGCEFAVGAWNAMTGMEKMVGCTQLHPRVKMRMAIQAACASDTDCGGGELIGFWTKSGYV